MSGSTVFDCPARKMFLTDLCLCQDLPGNIKDNSPTAQLKIWQSNCSGIKVTFSIVTVQGTVVQVNTEDDCLYLDDGTSVAMVKGCGKIPFCAVKPTKDAFFMDEFLKACGGKGKVKVLDPTWVSCSLLGQYLMIVGQLQKSGSLPTIRAIKLQNLTDNVANMVIWPLEVIDELGQSR